MGEFEKQISGIATDIQSLSHELDSAKLQYLGIAAASGNPCSSPRALGPFRCTLILVGPVCEPTPDLKPGPAPFSSFRSTK
jgi:hypothetical protein